MSLIGKEECWGCDGAGTFFWHGRRHAAAQQSLTPAHCAAANKGVYLSPQVAATWRCVLRHPCMAFGPCWSGVQTHCSLWCAGQGHSRHCVCLCVMHRHTHAGLLMRCTLLCAARCVYACPRVYGHAYTGPCPYDGSHCPLRSPQWMGIVLAIVLPPSHEATMLTDQPIYLQPSDAGYAIALYLWLQVSKAHYRMCNAGRVSTPTYIGTVCTHDVQYQQASCKSAFFWTCIDNGCIKSVCLQQLWLSCFLVKLQHVMVLRSMFVVVMHMHITMPTPQRHSLTCSLPHPPVAHIATSPGVTHCAAAGVLVAV